MTSNADQHKYVVAGTTSVYPDSIITRSASVAKLQQYAFSVAWQAADLPRFTPASAPLRMLSGLAVGPPRCVFVRAVSLTRSMLVLDGWRRRQRCCDADRPWERDRKHGDGDGRGSIGAGSARRRAQLYAEAGIDRGRRHSGRASPVYRHRLRPVEVNQACAAASKGSSRWLASDKNADGLRDCPISSGAALAAPADVKFGGGEAASPRPP